MSVTPEIPKVTPYYLNHIENGATMMTKGGWQRPLRFKDPETEVRATRQALGLIDAHSMGKFEICGPGALPFIQWITTNDVTRVEEGRGAIYTLLCNDRGGIVDDIVVYYLSPTRFYFITNTLSTVRVHQWLEACVERFDGPPTFVFDVTNKTAYLSVQGPLSGALMIKLFGEAVRQLNYFQFMFADLLNVPVLLARTGYTGELGFELNFPSEFGYGVWKHVQENAAHFGGMPVGGEAVQVLRIEKGYRAHGTDMTVDNNPYEMGLGWLIRYQKANFIGRDALLRIRDDGTANRFVGFEAEGNCPLQSGTSLTCESGKSAGRVTSSCHSPTLDKIIALGFVERGIEAKAFRAGSGDVPVRRVDIPFYDRGGDRLRALL
jgi:aminomethyltransferase